MHFETFNNGVALYGTGHRKVDLETDADRLWHEEQATSRRNAVVLSNSTVFQCMVLVALATKSPLTYFMLWAQKAVKIFNTEVRKLEPQGHRYLGSSPLSQLVAQQGTRPIHNNQCTIQFEE